MPKNEKRVIVRSHILFKVNGPPQSYSSVEFGYDLEQEVEDDEAIIYDAARQLDELGDGLCAGRRDKAYRTLIKHLNAIESRSYRKEE